MSKIINGVWVDRITPVLLDYDDMLTVNYITGIDPMHEVNFVDYSEFESDERLRDYVSERELKALKDNHIDFIVFRLDD